MRDNELCDVTLASVDGQKFKAHKVILSASSIFFKKLLLNNLNHHPMIFLRKMENESHLLNQFYAKTKKNEGNQVEPFVIFITKIELFRLNERVIEEGR